MKIETTKHCPEWAYTIIKSIEDTQKVMNKNVNECLYGTKVEYKIAPGVQIKLIIREIKSRVFNAYDCLVKGVDPYDGY